MMRATIDRRMRRMDTDGDDRISRQEVGAGAGRFGQHLSAAFDRADADRNGFISRTELETALQEFRATRRAERQQEGGGAARGPAAGSGAPPAAPPSRDEDYGDSLDDEE
jgi:hypothetical protein